MADNKTAKEIGDLQPADGDPSSPQGQTEVARFVAELNDEERMLVLLKTELYEGSWQAMLEDLSNRLDGKPYIFKLANRIRDDVERIKRLQNFEDNNHVNLGRYVTPPKP